MASITRYLPRKILSRLVGNLVHLRLPWLLRYPLIWAFAKLYRINLEEAEKPLGEYPSLGEFFARALKPQARPLGFSSMVHCADSRITQIGVISDQTVVQAKGQTYALGEILGEEDSIGPRELEGGLFVTYYLCPRDYHRVHAPSDGEVLKVKYIPGDLWPVNSWSTQNVSRLFCLNERMVIEMSTPHGPLALVLVGATNVGFIELAFDASLKSNKGNSPRVRKYSPTVKIKKGEELGRFRMGSTVVVFLGPAWKNQLGDLSQVASRLRGSQVQVRADFKE